MHITPNARKWAVIFVSRAGVEEVMTIRTLEGTTVHDIVVAASQFCEDIHLNRAAMHKLNEACSHSPSMQPTSARIPYRRGRGTQTRGNIMVRAVDDMMDIIIRPD